MKINKIIIIESIITVIIFLAALLSALNYFSMKSCTDDCCPPNHCPYHNGCVTKQEHLCINPENNLTYTQEIEQGVKKKDWDLR